MRLQSLPPRGAREIFSRQTLDGFAFDVEVLLLAERLGYKIADLPVEWINSPEAKVRIVRDSLAHAARHAACAALGGGKSTESGSREIAAARPFQQPLLKNASSMRLLVTGGCGFIGSNFIRYVLAALRPGDDHAMWMR